MTMNISSAPPVATVAPASEAAPSVAPAAATVESAAPSQSAFANGPVAGMSQGAAIPSAPPLATGRSPIIKA